MKFSNTWSIFGTDKKGSNIILLDSSKLLAAALARDVQNPTGSGLRVFENYHYKGIQFHAIGSGDPNWVAGDYASGLSINSSGLVIEKQRAIPEYCKYVTDFVSTAIDGNKTIVHDDNLLQFKQSDLIDLILYIGSGTNAGESGTIVQRVDKYSDESLDAQLDIVKVSPAFSSDVDNTSVYEIRNVPSHDGAITNKIRMKTTFSHSGTESYIIREHGLFGANATSELNSGIIFNHAMFSGTQQIEFGPGSGTTLEFVMKLQ